MIQSTKCFECEEPLDYFDGILMCLSCRKKYHVPLLEESNRESMTTYLAKSPEADRPETGKITLDTNTKSKSMSPEDLLTWIQAGGKIESG